MRAKVFSLLLRQPSSYRLAQAGIPFYVGKFMANKRMFSKQIVETDAFLDMPKTSQLLYFHLNMEADDDGFVASPKKVMRVIGSGDDDIKILLAKRFLLSFDSGVVVIKHWLIHNYIRKDTYTETKYLSEKKSLEIKDNGSYTERGRLVDGSSTQIRLDKVSVDNNNATDVAPAPKKKIWKDEDPMTCVEFVRWCRKSTQKQIQIIGEWAEAESPKHTIYGEWKSFIKRNLRPAKNLVAYDIKKIEKAYQLMLKDVVHLGPGGKKVGFITKYGLETVAKYIDLV